MKTKLLFLAITILVMVATPSCKSHKGLPPKPKPHSSGIKQAEEQQYFPFTYKSPIKEHGWKIEDIMSGNYRLSAEISFSRVTDSTSTEFDSDGNFTVKTIPVIHRVVIGTDKRGSVVHVDSTKHILWVRFKVDDTYPVIKFFYSKDDDLFHFKGNTIPTNGKMFLSWNDNEYVADGSLRSVYLLYKTKSIQEPPQIINDVVKGMDDKGGAGSKSKDKWDARD